MGLLYMNARIIESLSIEQILLVNIKIFGFSLKDGSSLMINHFEIPALFSCQPAGKNSGNFKIVSNKAGSIL